MPHAIIPCLYCRAPTANRPPFCSEAHEEIYLERALVNLYDPKVLGKIMKGLEWGYSKKGKKRGRKVK